MLKHGTFSDAWAVPAQRERFDARELQNAGINVPIAPSTERASVGWEPQERRVRKAQVELVREHISSFHIATGGGPAREVKMIQLCHDPWIVEFENFATDEECDYLLALGHRMGFEPSKTSLGKEKSDEQTYKSVTSLSRTSWTSHISGAGDPLFRTIEKRVGAVLGEDVGHMEPPQLLRYEPGQEFKVHHDGDFRKYTALLYLNEVHKGGETEFTSLKFCLKPKRGCLVAWKNCLAKNEADMRMLHAGLPVAEGIKYCVPFFIHYVPPKRKVVYAHGP